MRETKKPVLSTAVLVVNGLLICVFLLFGAMLVYITANLSSENSVRKGLSVWR